MKKYNCCALRLKSGGTLVLRRKDYSTYKQFEDDVLKRLRNDVIQVWYTNSLVDLNHFIFNGNPYKEMRCL